ncbi:MAG TPA: hypothetical protein VLC48_09885 [Gemmatimonadota bacterium]|nr:hypothetical protein [Gemmatimonadota bacterium]
MAHRDSAGISVVESRAPAWSEGEGWRLATSPDLVVGVVEGSTEYQLFQVSSAGKLPDGRIVISNGGSQEIRFYDGEGKFLMATGREGEGPGEFKGIGPVWLLGADSLAVFDYRLARLSVFSTAGQFARTARLESCNDGAAFATGLFGDGSLVAMSVAIDREAPRTSGPYRYPNLYCLYTTDGVLLDSLGTFPGDEGYAAAGDASLRVSARRPFGRQTQVALGVDRWFVGTSDSYEIEMRDLDGSLTHIIRRPVANRPIPKEVAEEARRRMFEMLQSMGGRVDGPAPLPETMPAYASFLLDAEGNLWVEEYRIGDEEPQWAVFNPEGRFLGIVEVPRQGQVMEIGSDYVLGVWSDELGSEQVRLYELIR